MVHGSVRSSPLSREVLVALDLETTGLSPQQDEIIEVGAVKFRGDQVLDTYSTLVNPHRPLPDVVSRMTGITGHDLHGAPPFAAIAGEVEAFIGGLPLVGHNIPFDMAFLAQKDVRLSPLFYDTWDLASVLLPQRRSYSLAPLAASLGVEHPQPHRALPDAQVTRLVLLALLEVARGMDVRVLQELQRLALSGQWPLGQLLVGLEEEHPAAWEGGRGLDLEALGQRLAPGRPLRQGKKVAPVGEDVLEALFQDEGPVSQAMVGYERRDEQVRMMQRVTRALNEGHHLIVEGGTGIGKSLAYLIPAALFALQNQARVVISTGTINLQEQLISKDIPIALQALASQEQEPSLRAVHLKGRANYLCLRRWSHLRAAEALSTEEARVLGKVLVWLQSTSTGDRAEITMPSAEERLWDRLSAWGAQECVEAEPVCFLQAARERARAAHLLIVNHALLLADAAAGGTLLPEHQHLIVDEAHHLEEEATQQFGFQVSQEAQLEALSALLGQRGLFQQVRAFLRRRGVPPLRRERLEEELVGRERGIVTASSHLGRLYQVLRALVEEMAEDRDGASRQLWVTPAVRTQPAWSRLEGLWQEADLDLGAIVRGLDGLADMVRDLASADPVLADVLQMEISNQAQATRDERVRLREVVAEPQQGMVYWLAQSGREDSLRLHGAPLEVGELLQQRLYANKRSVILTGATLATGGSFAHFRQRVGLQDAEEHVEGSPFDYRRGALLLVPQDMPNPNSADYTRALASAVTDLARAAQGHTMALFTSHSALRATRRVLQPALEAQGIPVRAQGVDGSPRRLLDAFLEEPRSVLLGTSSFWEGVDVPAGALKVLVLARLPFQVPTDPVFAARSELFDAPFTEYAVPQAVLRFRQGFGRLIRRHQDRGVVVVLDQRLIGKPYGATFLNSLPECTFKTPLLAGLFDEVRRWIGG